MTLDTKVYLIFNTGHLDYIFYNKEERDNKYAELLERESHYQCTHYYYSKEEVTLGQFICQNRCEEVKYALNNSRGGNERTGMDEETYFNFLMSNNCCTCPMKCHSPYWKFDNERVENEKKAQLERIPKLENEIHKMRQEICSKCGKGWDKETKEKCCSKCKWGIGNYKLNV